MKYSPCPKCKSNEIGYIKGGALSGNASDYITIGMKMIYPSKYICLVCGYAETYIEKSEDLEVIRKKNMIQNKDGFV
jgi:predicted nucleic-acid-binding Zn-ribbon protein